MAGEGGEVLNRDRLAALRDLCDGADDLMVELARLYVDEMPGRVRSLLEEVAARDFDRARELAHLVKGASVDLGADSMADLCRALEAATAERSAERSESLAHEVVALMPRVCHALVHEIGGV
jgi:HPt (histidine-containing phosphotransfer) domain-containing protein